MFYALSPAALSGTNDENTISEFLDKLIDGSNPFSVPSGELKTFVAAVADLSARHEEL